MLEHLCRGITLAQFFFSLYISADNTGLIHGDDESDYLRQLDSFVNYCDSNILDLNVSKEKEIITNLILYIYEYKR